MQRHCCWPRISLNNGGISIKVKIFQVRELSFVHARFVYGDKKSVVHEFSVVKFQRLGGFELVITVESSSTESLRLRVPTKGLLRSKRRQSHYILCPSSFQVFLPLEPGAFIFLFNPILLILNHIFEQKSGSIPRFDVSSDFSPP